jgi:hypothetical protein
MKRMVTVVVVALGMAVVVGGGVWAVSTLTGDTHRTAAEVVVNPQMAAVPNGSVSTGDGSMEK